MGEDNKLTQLERDPDAKHYGSKEKERKSFGRARITGLDASQGKVGKGVLGRWENLSKGPGMKTAWSVWGPQRAYFRFSEQRVKE